MRDLREYARQSSVRFVLGIVILLFVVGVALIWVFYGGGAAGFGLTCLLASAFPIILILGVFVTIEWILKHVRPK